jgi:hypothetical protein
VLIAPIALVNANADLLVGILIGVAVGFLAGPVLRAWLTYVEWTETSREARLTEELISRFGRDLDELPEADQQVWDHETTPGDERAWRTSR